jgi:Subtilase family
VPERPLLRLPDPEPFAPRAGPRGGASIFKPTRDRQRERLQPRFQRLMGIAASPQQLLSLRDDPASIAPERAIVFEVAGSLQDFYQQAKDLGLEYLGDFEEEFTPTDDFHDKDDSQRHIGGRIYLAMPDVQALRELLSLWKRFTDGQNMPQGKGPWRELFSNLLDIRPWGPQDRVPPETLAFWRSTIATNPGLPVRFEIELWFYENPDRRAQAYERIEQVIREVNGSLIHHAVIPEIRYDAALVDLPPDQIQAILDNPDITLSRVDEVMFLRPQSIGQHPRKDGLEGAEGQGQAGDSQPAGAPIAALLDGLPIQNHVRLSNRIIVDDPDDLEPAYPVNRRRHGTEMASLIIHGDLNQPDAPLPRPLFVFPVMQPNSNGDERTPASRLLVDVIYRAVRRIKEADGDQPASAPEVILINFSLGDANRPFARVMSPLGRLLDFLAHRYRILFFVSAGNITDRLSVPGFGTSIDFENASPEQREKAILEALNASKSQRTLYSPAEAINVLTIGAAHSDSAFSGTFPPNLIDPFTDEELPNIVSAMGLGFRKVVKPELLLQGGRAPVRVVGSGGELLVAPPSAGARYFGLKAASPNDIGGDRYEDFTWGTSAATALATRAAHKIHDVLLDGNGGSNHADIPPEFEALVLKALLVHGAAWGPKGRLLDKIFPPQGQGSHFARRDDIARLLGYGVPKLDRVLDCAANRATLVGYGTIAPGAGMLYRIPLPSGLDGVRALRALTVTLAWFSPLNSRHQGYRMAALDVSPGTDEKYWITSTREPCQPTDKATMRGTVFHERRSGESATVFMDDGHILLRVSCRATAGELTESVPYAMAVSFEVGIDAGIQVYDQIRERLAARVRAAV